MSNDNDKDTSKQGASEASNVLRDGRTADKSKSAAGSALSQAQSDDNNRQ